MNYTKKLNLLDDFLTFYCNEILSTLQYINGYDFTDNKSQLENLPKSITAEANKKLYVSAVRNNHVTLMYEDKKADIRFRFSDTLIKKENDLDWGHPEISKTVVGFDTMTLDKWKSFRKAFHSFAKKETKWSTENEIEVETLNVE